MNSNVGSGFQVFGDRFPRAAKAHMGLVQEQGSESALDDKTAHLAYLAVLVASGLTGGLPFHVQVARQAGASDQEILSACLVGLPAVGLTVLDGLAVAEEALNATAH